MINQTVPTLFLSHFYTFPSLSFSQTLRMLIYSNIFFLVTLPVLKLQLPPSIVLSLANSPVLFFSAGRDSVATAEGNPEDGQRELPYYYQLHK